MRLCSLILQLILAGNTFANCKIRTSSNNLAAGQSDILSEVLGALPRCPQNVFQLKDVLASDGLDITPSMVANRGRHNPRFGSFSFFEVATGRSTTMGIDIQPSHLYFGHFTHTSKGVVDLDQTPARGKLMVELIAWDFTKQMYNFYELIGTSSGGVWFYRGDSRDAYADNRLLHLQPNPGRPVFGRNMRCSACHSSGGPIMKELKAPHNDWWTRERPLPFGGNRISDKVNEWLEVVVGASEFSDAVKAGIDLLNQSAAMQRFKRQLSLPEQLRPLFCTTEINLVSDIKPLGGMEGDINVPSEYFVNPILLANGGQPIFVAKADYLAATKQLNFQFPEIKRADADHAWLAPVKGFSDLATIKNLVISGVVDQEFVADVLAVDMRNPMFSKDRCDLLRQIPKAESVDWLEQFTKNLKKENSLSAVQLLENLQNPERTVDYHRSQAQVLLELVAASLPNQLTQRLIELDQKRISVFSSEISMNPLGQILEPGFRVIFPVRN